MAGIYFYGDYCAGRIWGAELSGSSWVAVELTDTNYSISTFGEGEDGGLYLADYSSGRIYKVIGLDYYLFLPLILR